MIRLLLKNTFPYILFHMSKYIPWTQEMCNEVVQIEPYALEFVTDHFKTQEMCNKVIKADLYTLRYVPDNLKAHEMFIGAVGKDL